VFIDYEIAGISVPSQRLSTGELAFLAQNVPASGSPSFHLSTAAPHVPANAIRLKLQTDQQDVPLQECKRSAEDSAVDCSDFLHHGRKP
jgi:hypothetical protein